MTSLADGDLEVFVLVRPADGSGGALWAGDERLSDEFRRQRLCPGAADVEVTMDAGFSALVRKEAKTDGTVVCQPFVPLGAHALKSRKRQSTTQHKKSHSQVKVSRQSQAHDLAFDFETSSHKSTSTGTGGDHVHRNPSHTPFLANASPTNFEFHNNQNFSHEENTSTFNGENEDVGWIYDDFVPRNPKTRDVTTIHDSSVTVKNSYAFKLLNTVLYAFGREVYMRCPYKSGQLKDESCRLFFARCFDAFFNHFPNLVELDRQKVGFHKTRLKKPYLLSLKSYCRSVVQMSFCKSFTAGPGGTPLAITGADANGL